MIRAGNLYDTWLKVLKKVYAQGEEVLDERGSETLELTNIVSSFPNPFIKGPNGIEIIPEYHDYWKGKKLDAYVEQFNSPVNDGFIYTYGNRIRRYRSNHEIDFIPLNDGIGGYSTVVEYEYKDQIDEVVRKLKDNPYTRRAEIITWDVFTDNENKEVPCLIMVDYKIRKEKLQTTAVWRSHDLYGAWFPNMIGLAYQTKEIANKVGVEIGDFIIQSISAHIYKTDIDEIKKLVNK